MGSITYEPLMTSEGKEIMKERGWDKGLVVFGAALSEATVKALTAATLLTSRFNDFGFPHQEFRHVDMDFNDKDTWTPDGKGKVGVWSPAWRTLSKSGPMPGIALDGELRLDSNQILAGLAKAYLDRSLTPEEQAEVMWWIGLNERFQDKLMEAVIHWGWAGFHGRVNDMPKDRYEKAMAPLEKGKKDLAWEKSKIREVDDFFSEFEKKLTGKPITGYLVGGKTTLADCALCNWYQTMHNIGNLEMANRYPATTKHYLKMIDLDIPKGATDHYQGFAMFGKVVHAVNVCGRDRGCCGTHDINNPILWS